MFICVALLFFSKILLANAKGKSHCHGRIAVVNLNPLGRGEDPGRVILYLCFVGHFGRKSSPCPRMQQEQELGCSLFVCLAFVVRVAYFAHGILFIYFLREASKGKTPKRAKATKGGTQGTGHRIP